MPGHENVGVIAEVGEGVEGFKVGDRVVAGPPGNCGHCFHCTHGRPNLCVDGFGTTNGLTRDGGMAEYMLVRDARQMLYPIPDNVSFEDAVLTDTLATALRAISQSDLAMGDNVVVSGAGPIGLAAISVFKLAGARHVTSLEIVPEKRALAAALGADLVLDPVAEAEGLKDRIAAVYGGLGPDIVAECAGKAQSLGLCIEVVRNGGQVLNIGAGGEPLPIIPAMLAVREVGLKSSLAYGAQEARLVLDYLVAGRFDTGGMLSDVIPLADVVEKGFRRLVADALGKGGRETVIPVPARKRRRLAAAAVPRQAGGCPSGHPQDVPGFQQGGQQLRAVDDQGSLGGGGPAQPGDLSAHADRPGWHMSARYRGCDADIAGAGSPPSCRRSRRPVPIRRERDSLDARLTRVYVTEVGREIDRQKGHIREARMNEIFADMDPGYRTDLCRRLDDLTERIQRVLHSDGRAAKAGG